MVWDYKLCNFVTLQLYLMFYFYFYIDINIEQRIIQLIVSMKFTSLAVLLAVFVVFAASFTIEQQGLTNKLFALENFQFTNYTGSGISSDMVSNYNKIINNAYSFYGNDTNKSTDYISKQLESSYGYAYSVVILQSNQTLGSFFIYCVGGNTVVSWTKANTYQPNWRYMIWPIYKTTNLTTAYVTSLQKGIGIDSSKETIIRSVVKAQEQTVSSCGCYNVDMTTITDKLKQFDGQSWSIICKKYSSINYNSLLKSSNYQYIQLNVNTNKCEYVLLTN